MDRTDRPDGGGVDRVRDMMIARNPDLAGAVLARDQVVKAWCAEHGKDKDALTLNDVVAIRALPAWQRPG